MGGGNDRSTSQVAGPEDLERDRLPGGLDPARPAPRRRRDVPDQHGACYVATRATNIRKKDVTVANPSGPDLVQGDVILWDIMGTSTVRELLKQAYYHGAQGILAVADLTRRDTLIALDEWARSIRSVAGDIPTFGVANKADLEKDRALSAAEVEAFFREGR